MANPPSYFQTLSPQDRIAFIASLQQVKEHLQGELEWMNQQVQQKTVQLQGIETLLLEASALELPEPPSDDQTAPVSEAFLSSIEPLVQASPTEAASLADEMEPIPQANGRGASKPDPLTQNIPNTRSKDKKQGAKTTKQPARSKSAATKKPSGTATKVPKPAATKPAAKSPGKGSGSSRRQTLRERLVPKYAGQSLTNVVAQILAAAKEPLHLDEIVTEMYGNLTDEDFQQAKVSLTKVLSVGKQEGKWHGMGDGLYRSNKVVTP